MKLCKFLFIHIIYYLLYTNLKQMVFIFKFSIKPIKDKQTNTKCLHYVHSDYLSIQINKI